jgi:hypothetical protein
MLRAKKSKPPPKLVLVPEKPTDAVIAFLLDNETPFICHRNSPNEAGSVVFVVVEQTNEDWRTVMNKNIKHHGDYATREEADVVCNQLIARWRWKQLLKLANVRNPVKRKPS